jgi:hypothetical protein
VKRLAHLVLRKRVEKHIRRVRLSRKKNARLEEGWEYVFHQSSSAKAAPPKMIGKDAAAMSVLELKNLLTLLTNKTAKQMVREINPTTFAKLIIVPDLSPSGPSHNPSA